MLGKSTFFVAKQSALEDVPVDKLKNLEKELEAIEDEDKELQAQLKAATSGIDSSQSFSSNDTYSGLHQNSINSETRPQMMT